MLEYFKSVVSNPLVKNYLKIFSVDLLVKGSGVILLPVYLQMMTQDEFGIYGYMVAIIGTFSLVFNLGIYVAQSKLYHDYPAEQRPELLGTMNILLFVFTAGLAIIIFFFNADYPVVNFLFKNDLDYHKYRPAVLIGVFVSVYSLMLTNYFLTSEDIRKVQLMNIARTVLVNAIVIAMLYYSVESDNALVRLKYSNLVELSIIGFFIIFYIRKMKFSFNIDIARRSLAIGFPVLISGFLGIFINLSDRFFLEKFGSLRDLSVYNLALSISSIVPFIFASFQNVWLPHFLKEKNLEQNREKSRRVIWKLLTVFVMLSVLIIVALKAMLALNIIPYKYDEILPLLPIVLTTTILTSLTTMFSNHLVYLNKLHLIIVVGVPLAALAVVLNTMLVPLLNIYGAAIASLILNAGFLISYSLLVRYFYNQKIKLPPQPRKTAD